MYFIQAAVFVFNGKDIQLMQIRRIRNVIRVRTVRVTLVRRHVQTCFASKRRARNPRNLQTNMCFIYKAQHMQSMSVPCAIYT